MQTIFAGRAVHFPLHRFNRYSRYDSRGIPPGLPILGKVLLSGKVYQVEPSSKFVLAVAHDALPMFCPSDNCRRDVPSTRARSGC